MTMKLYSLSDISEILGITNQGVSNIKRRHESVWPEPTYCDQKGRNALYDLQAVATVIRLRFSKDIAIAIINTLED